VESRSIDDKERKSESNPMLQAALELLVMGFRPIPIAENSKKPLISWKEFQKKPPSENQLVRWWRKWPNANLAVLTGTASGVDAVDLDVGHEPWPPEGYELPKGCVVRTPRGGYHYFYRHTPGVQSSAGRLAKGVDIRGDGGYVLVVPSVVNGKGYEIESGSLAEAHQTVAPDWLRDALLGTKGKSAAIPRMIPDGQRNDELTRIAGSMRRRGMNEEAMLAALLEVNVRRCQPPLPEDEVCAIARSIGKKPPGNVLEMKPQYTDAWHARRFVEEHGKHLRYCAALKTWYFWNGRYWEKDTKLHIERLAQEFILRQYAKACEIADKDEREDWIKHVRTWEHKRSIEAMIQLSRSLGRVAVKPEALDSNDFLLNTLSGTLVFAEEGTKVTLKAHNPEDMMTKMCPVEYDKSASNPLWQEFLETATQGDRELELFIQRCIGYSLVGSNPEEQFFFVFGPAASGKTTFLEAVKTVLGDCAVTINASMFLEQRYSGGAQPEVVKIRGARIVAASETEPGQKFNSDLMKGLSGGDTIGARDLYAKPIEFRFNGKLWLVSNHAPLAPVGDEAFLRRMTIIPFRNQIPKGKRKPSIKKALTNPKVSGPAILNWMIEGFLNYQRIGLMPPKPVDDSIENYKAEINPLTDWAIERCTVDRENPEMFETAASLYGDYKRWADENNVRHPMTSNSFGRCLTAMGLQNDVRSIRGTKARVWGGIKLNR